MNEMTHSELRAAIAVSETGSMVDALTQLLRLGVQGTDLSGFFKAISGNCLSFDNPVVRSLSYEVLQYCQCTDKGWSEVALVVQRDLDSEDKALRVSALSMITRLPQKFQCQLLRDSFRALETSLEDTHPAVRRASCHAVGMFLCSSEALDVLGGSDDESVKGLVAALVGCLLDTTDAVCLAAFRGLDPALCPSSRVAVLVTRRVTKRYDDYLARAQLLPAAAQQVPLSFFCGIIMRVANQFLLNPHDAKSMTVWGTGILLSGGTAQEIPDFRQAKPIIEAFMTRLALPVLAKGLAGGVSMAGLFEAARTVFSVSTIQTLTKTVRTQWIAAAHTALFDLLSRRESHALHQPILGMLIGSVGALPQYPVATGTGRWPRGGWSSSVSGLPPFRKSGTAPLWMDARVARVIDLTGVVAAQREARCRLVAFRQLCGTVVSIAVAEHFVNGLATHPEAVGELTQLRLDQQDGSAALDPSALAKARPSLPRISTGARPSNQPRTSVEESAAAGPHVCGLVQAALQAVRQRPVGVLDAVASFFASGWTARVLKCSSSPLREELMNAMWHTFITMAHQPVDPLMAAFDIAADDAELLRTVTIPLQSLDPQLNEEEGPPASGSLRGLSCAAWMSVALHVLESAVEVVAWPCSCEPVLPGLDALYAYSEEKTGSTSIASRTTVAEGFVRLIDLIACHIEDSFWAAYQRGPSEESVPTEPSLASSGTTGTSGSGDTSSLVEVETVEIGASSQEASRIQRLLRTLLGDCNTGTVVSPHVHHMLLLLCARHLDIPSSMGLANDGPDGDSEPVLLLLSLLKDAFLATSTDRGSTEKARAARQGRLLQAYVSGQPPPSPAELDLAGAIPSPDLRSDTASQILSSVLVIGLRGAGCVALSTHIKSWLRDVTSIMMKRTGASAPSNLLLLSQCAASASVRTTIVEQCKNTHSRWTYALAHPQAFLDLLRSSQKLVDGSKEKGGAKESTLPTLQAASRLVAPHNPTNRAFLELDEAWADSSLPLVPTLASETISTPFDPVTDATTLQYSTTMAISPDLHPQPPSASHVPVVCSAWHTISGSSDMLLVQACHRADASRRRITVMLSCRNATETPISRFSVTFGVSGSGLRTIERTPMIVRTCDGLKPNELTSTAEALDTLTQPSLGGGYLDDDAGTEQNEWTTSVSYAVEGFPTDVSVHVKIYFVLAELQQRESTPGENMGFDEGVGDGGFDETDDQDDEPDGHIPLSAPDTLVMTCSAHSLPFLAFFMPQAHARARLFSTLPLSARSTTDAVYSLWLREWDAMPGLASNEIQMSCSLPPGVTSVGVRENIAQKGGFAMVLARDFACDRSFQHMFVARTWFHDPILLCVTGTMHVHQAKHCQAHFVLTLKMRSPSIPTLAVIHPHLTQWLEDVFGRFEHIPTPSNTDEYDVPDDTPSPSVQVQPMMVSPRSPAMPGPLFSTSFTSTMTLGSEPVDEGSDVWQSCSVYDTSTELTPWDPKDPDTLQVGAVLNRWNAIRSHLA